MAKKSNLINEVDKPPDWPERSIDDLMRDKERYEKRQRSVSGWEHIEKMRELRQSMDFGNVGGRPLEVPPHLKMQTVKEMDHESLTSALLNLQEICLDMWTKLQQFAIHVPREIISRDPGVVIGIHQGTLDGKSDAEIGSDLGEKAKFIQETRIQMGIKKRRGRPKKSPPTTR